MSFCLPGGRCGSNLGCFLEALAHLWCHLGWSLQACGCIWARLAQAGYPTEPFGIPVHAGAPIYEICHVLGPESWPACGGLLQPSRSPIEEDKMIRFRHPDTQILDSSCLGAWRLGLLDFSCLATWAGWTDVLFWALLRGLGDGNGYML